MNILTDSMIYNDLKEIIVNNYSSDLFLVFLFFIYLLNLFILIIVAIVNKIKKRKIDFHTYKVISSILFIHAIFISIIITIISRFFVNFIIDNGIKKLEYTVTIEVLEEKFLYNNLSWKTPHYLVFNNNLLIDSKGKEKEKYQINVTRKLFHNVYLGDKMYVVRDYRGYIVLVYSCKDYKYSNDNNLTTN